MRFTYVCLTPCVHRSSYVTNLKSLLLCCPTLGHEFQEMFERFFVAALFLLGQLPRALVELRRHLHGLFLRTAKRNQNFSQLRGVHEQIVIKIPAKLNRRWQNTCSSSERHPDSADC